MLKSDLPNPDSDIKSCRNPTVAVLLSLFLFSGSGQIYLGQIKKGLLLIGLTLFLWIFGSGWLVTIAGTLDAYILAKKLRKGQPIGEWTFFSRADLIEIQKELVPNKWIITMIGFVAGVIGAALGLLPFLGLHEFLAGLLPEDASRLLFILAFGYPIHIVAAIFVLPLGGAIMGTIGANIGANRHIKNNIGDDYIWWRVTFWWGLIFGFFINLFFGVFSY